MPKNPEELEQGIIEVLHDDSQDFEDMVGSIMNIVAEYEKVVRREAQEKVADRISRWVVDGVVEGQSSLGDGMRDYLGK